ncbi:TonB-dependent receptor [Hymenobacter sp. BT186]|uniref:TonB-dependent receptor n=1 Tax=Hymenobacter telluris TaxID=2816474 RepID=A0A939JCU2_9BACT|nr:TonB-dependent receptor [Hymenobacter telluris]MBO0360551.1 TonB-dependent receptor [Hymenobacter telluris]MBW3376578.1 TonB-dependent receptor [Hymenobacter norwichensis]
MANTLPSRVRLGLSAPFLCLTWSLLPLQAGGASLLPQQQEILSRTISLEINNLELKTALARISQQADVKFVYSSRIVDAHRKVTLQVQQQQLATVLTQLFAPLNLAYEVLKGQVVISRAAATGATTPGAGTSADVSVTGRVVDEKGAGLPGVTVVVKGTTQGTSTDGNGNFTLAVPSGSTLIFSSIGFVAQEVPVTGATLNVVLVENTKALDEVVVIGYGTVKKRDLTGAVYSVKSDDIVKTPTHNAVEALQGRVPGADITRTSGAAGSGTNIVIRGNRSIDNQGTGQVGLNKNGPLVVIDGYQGGDISDLNPNDIESIEVLKDASSTAIYGALGANGVLIVTTKRGAAGKVQVDYSGYYGVNDYQFPASRIGADYVALRREAWRTTGDWNSPADDARIFPDPGEYDAVQNGQFVDWVDLVKRRGSQQSHAVSLRGGSDKTKVFSSLGYFREEGMLRNNDYNRYNARLNVDQTISKIVKVGLMSQVNYYKQDNRQNPLGQATQLSPLGLAYNEAGEINQYPIAADQTRVSPLADERGPYVARDNTIRTNVIANGYLEVTPLKGLSFRSNFGTNLDFRRRGIYNDRTSLFSANNRTAVASTENVFSRFMNWDNILTYSREIGKHSVALTGITSYIRSDVDNSYASGTNQLLASQLFYDLNSTSTAVTRTLRSPNGAPYTGSENMAYAARLNYSFAGKYLFTVSGRYDGASRLAPGNKWDFFPSVAVGWNVSDEAFLHDASWLSQLKLRASYGVSGNYSISPYGTQSVLAASSRMSFGEVPAQFYQFQPTVGNPDLGWEKSANLNLGLDLGLFDNRLTATIDGYNTNTSDILLLRPLPISSGVTQVYQNIGATQNRGIELAITSQNIVTEKLKWSSTLTFSRNREKITKLIDGRDIIGTSNPEVTSLLLGRPINSFYSYQKLGIWQTNEADVAAQYKIGNYTFQPGDIKLADLNGDLTFNASDQAYIGSTVPKWVAGLQNTISYRGFDLSMLALARYGQFINAQFLGRYNPSGSGNGPSIINYWTPENPTNDFPRPRRGTTLSSYQGYTGYQALNFVDGSFFKIRTLTLGYNLPKTIANKALLANARVYVTGSNLLLITKSDLIKDYDPERGGDESTPLSRQIVVGLNLGF